MATSCSRGAGRGCLSRFPPPSLVAVDIPTPPVVAPPAGPATAVTTEGPGAVPPASDPDRERSSSELPQPEQELTPQVSINVGPESTELPADGPAWREILLPEDSGDDLLTCQSQPILLAQTPFECESDQEPLLESFFLDGCPESDRLLAEDDLPWIPDPLRPNSEQAYCLEIPMKEKDIRKWLKESHPGYMTQVAVAGKKARAEFRLKELTCEDRELFAQAKTKELNCWLQTNAVRRILRKYLNPEQILRSRWVLTWKAPEVGSSVRKAKAA